MLFGAKRALTLPVVRLLSLPFPSVDFAERRAPSLPPFGGGIDAIEKILRIGVYVQCTGDFTQQSETADAASDLMHRVFAQAGVHARTSVGVYALPKNAAVVLDMIVAARDGF
jgi:hypothetical protein